MMQRTSAGATPGYALAEIPPLQPKVNSGNNKIMYQDNLTALADATNDLLGPAMSIAGAATDEDDNALRVTSP